MKKENVIILTMLCCITFGCEKFATKVIRITFTNNSNMVVCLSKQYNQPDSLIRSTNYFEVQVGEKTNVDVSYSTLDNNNENKIQVFVFSKDTIDKYGFDYVKANYLILKRYDLLYYKKKRDRDKSSNMSLTYP